VTGGVGKKKTPGPWLACHKFTFADDWVNGDLFEGVTTQEYEITGSSNGERAKVSQIMLSNALGSTVSTQDTRLDRRYTVGLPLLALSQLHHVSPLEGLRPL
jgi:hypothetical protein